MLQGNANDDPEEQFCCRKCALETGNYDELGGWRVPHMWSVLSAPRSFPPVGRLSFILSRPCAGILPHRVKTALAQTPGDLKPDELVPTDSVGVLNHTPPAKPADKPMENLEDLWRETCEAYCFVSSPAFIQHAESEASGVKISPAYKELIKGATSGLTGVDNKA
ncbi:hypothetical protein C7212DRAFT_341941 [Tuber magnatum]|uniref:Uncharacterized protein n=1 Tax=Tuber magnatum TaxID=42249 RepID=A0A317T2P3_9PEZI|nr:hypothetical protein C7212DRAFT_341941 [Tuber magnatum]